VKRRIFNFFIFSIFVLFFYIRINSVIANPVVSVPIEHPVLRVIILTNMFIFGTFLEYWLFRLKINEIQIRKKELLRPIFKVNLVTFPLTQILAYIVYIYAFPFFWVYIIGIEFAVIIAEWLLFSAELRKKYNPIPSKLILTKMILVNIVSFLVGLIAFVPPSLFPPYLFY